MSGRRAGYAIGTLLMFAAVLAARNSESAGGSVAFRPFVVTNGNSITLFDPSNLVPRTITAGIGNPRAAAFDAVGNLYVVNAPSAQYVGGSITVYAKAAPQTPRSISEGINNPVALAFDGADRLYVANQRASATAPADCPEGCVTVYSPGTASPLRTIANGITNPTALALDFRGYLYVANSPLSGAASVAVYAPGSASPAYTLISGVSRPTALAFDRSGDLYVANSGSVTVYAFGRTSPLRTIVQDLSAPDALAFDAAGNLYVANLDKNDVTVYAPETSAYVREITAGVREPTALAFDARGRLYVSNQFGSTGVGTVTVYAPGGQYIRAISAGVSYPTALAFAESSAVLPLPAPSPSIGISATSAPLPRGAWSSAPAMPGALNELAAVGDANNGTLYVVGGQNSGYWNELWAFDPSTNAWSTKASMPTPRCCLAAGITGTTLYAVGGDLGYDTPTGELDAYDPSTDAWTVKASMPTPRIYLAVAGANGVIYAVGGRSEASPSVVYNTLEAYDPATNSWATRAPMPTARFLSWAGVIDGILYVAGGFSSTNAGLDKLEAYDPSTNTWTTKAPLPARRGAFAAGVVGGILYVVSGSNGTPAYDRTVDAYDPATNAWTTGLAPIQTPRTVFAAGVVNGVIYAVGGNYNNAILSSMEAFTPSAASSPIPPTPAPSPSANYRIVHSFVGGRGDGADPAAGVIEVNGVLYGTTQNGGAYAACADGCGTIFGVTKAGAERVLHSFGRHGDGSMPQAGLVFLNGALYGTTTQGGAFGPPCWLNCDDNFGTVFAIDPSGANYRVVRSFGNGSDGNEPEAPLLESRGVFYGTTNQGPGQLTCSDGGCGTVFSLTTNGAEKQIFGFRSYARDGDGPQSAGVNDVGGTLYGVTNFGGRYDPGNGWADHVYGTVFSVTTSGKETVLHNFGEGTDGSGPSATLLNVGDTLYGVTNQGGAYGGQGGGHGGGTAFSIGTNGRNYRLLHSFGSPGDGTGPDGALIFVHGTIYGTTTAGGAYGCGTIFSLNPSSGAERVLYSFCSSASDGNTPYAGLTYAGGTLYGTTNRGGTQNDGTVFAFTP